MFGLLRELTSSRTPEKVLVREEANNLITKRMNVIALIKVEEEKGIEGDEITKGSVMELNELESLEPIKSPDKKEEVEEGTNGRSLESIIKELKGVETKAKALVEMPRSRHIGFYLKHEIKKTNRGSCRSRHIGFYHKYNELFLATRLGKIDHETCKPLPAKPMYNAILKKKLVKKDDME
nr:hypothetical protein [Tanacetum cinerariifolium]